MPQDGQLRVKVWKGPHKPVINVLEAGLGLLGWTRYDGTGQNSDKFISEWQVHDVLFVKSRWGGLAWRYVAVWVLLLYLRTYTDLFVR